MGARNTGVRGLVSVQFFEKKRRKAWFTKAEEEVCWEQWTLDVTLATPRTESGMDIFPADNKLSLIYVVL
jgi:autophagy-related protein 101